MVRHLADRIDTVVAVVTIGAGLRNRVDHAVIEQTTEREGTDFVANAAIDRNRWMADRGSGRIRAVVTGFATVSNHIDVGVIGKGFDKTLRRMAAAAIAVGGDVILVLTTSEGTVMAGMAGACCARVIEAAVGQQF